MCVCEMKIGIHQPLLFTETVQGLECGVLHRFGMYFKFVPSLVWSIEEQGWSNPKAMGAIYPVCSLIIFLTRDRSIGFEQLELAMY